MNMELKGFSFSIPGNQFEALRNPQQDFG
jgi:hypothetical protein